MNGLTIIDTPGINDAEAQTRRAERAVRSADLVIVVLRASQLLGAEIRQRAAVWMANELGKPVVPVLNGLNQIEPNEREELRRLLAQWTRSTLPTILEKPFYEVNALGALRYCVKNGARPTDDFLALQSSLEALVGTTSDKLQAISRTNQTRAVIRELGAWNQRDLTQLAEAADTLASQRENRLGQIHRTIQGISSRRTGEESLVNGLVQDQMSSGWRKLAATLVGKDKQKLETKFRDWFVTRLESAVREAESQISARLVSLANEMRAPAPDPITLWQLVSLQHRAKVEVTQPDNSGAVTGGALSGAAAGAVIGSVIPGIGTLAGAVLGLFAGMFIADEATQVQPDYVAAYTTALRTDWDKVAPTIQQAAGEQFKLRLNSLLKHLHQQVGELSQLPAASEELEARCVLEDRISTVLHQLST